MTSKQALLECTIKRYTAYMYYYRLKNDCSSSSSSSCARSAHMIRALMPPSVFPFCITVTFLICESMLCSIQACTISIAYPPVRYTHGPALHNTFHTYTLIPIVHRAHHAPIHTFIMYIMLLVTFDVRRLARFARHVATVFVADVPRRCVLKMP